jgi:ABC-2 type transport system ATP-binding protein
VLVTTHYLDEAEHCHRIAIIHAGRLAALGTTDELKHVFADRAIVEIQAPHAVEVMRALDAMGEVEKTSLFGTAVHAVLTSARPAAVQALEQRLRQAGIVPDAISVVPPSLEDVFLDVVDPAARSAGGA